MITLNQIKLDLIKSLPKYGIRIFFDTDYLTTTIINTDITVYNEKKIFGHFLSQNELNSNNDINYNKRVKISFLQKQERFRHYKLYLNQSEMDSINSPRGIINYEDNIIYILESKKDNTKCELGQFFEYIMTSGKSDLIDKIFKLDENINLKELYDINLFLEDNNNNLIKILEQLPNPEEKLGSIKKNIIIDNSNNIKIKKIYFDDEIKNEENEENISSDENFERRKIKMISANANIKYTFEKNTIQEYKRINGKLVPIKKNE